MEELMRVMNEWNAEEFMGAEGQEMDFSDLEHIGLVYTQSLDGAHDFQWEANLKNFTMTLYVDGEGFAVNNFGTAEEMTKYFANLYGGELISIADDLWEEAH